LLNASVGFQRVLERVRRPLKDGPASDAPREARRFAVAPKLRHGVHVVVAASRLAPVREPRTTIVAAAPVVVARAETPAQPRRSLISRLGHERAVAMVVVAIVVGASVLSVSAGHPAGPTGDTNGAGTEPRLAVGGDTTGDTAADTTGGAAVSGGTDVIDATDGTDGTGAGTGDAALGANVSLDTTDSTGSVEFGQPVVVPQPKSPFAAIDFGDTEISATDAAAVEGPFIDDGTLVKPIAVDTTVPDGSALVQTYKVKAGDTLTDIATKFKVSPMTVVWANDLKSKTDFKKGDTLRIPPVTGLIVKVAATDTLDSIAARYGVDGTDILATNGIDDPNLVVGQVLVLPGAKGRAMEKPTSKPSNRIPRSGGGGSNIQGPRTYTGGKFLFPVVGGNNYISQYFHYGHWAIDIAADYGTTVRAAAAGTVTFAGWKNNGGGYQVWVAHGSGLYTTYNHMSAITVGRGQHVGRGQQVGRVGQSGNATGPHCHFEVWRGPIWDGGQRVNPLLYL
jgi:murein DD-endopeptidase MepM/ murein hydrolase activator NlpD